MAKRVFNNCSLNGVSVSIGGFVAGSGEIVVSGRDVQYTTDDHVIHNLRTNISSVARFKGFGDITSLSTDPTSGVFGGSHIFYLDTTSVATFSGVVLATYSEKDNVTSITVTGEAEDA